MVRGSLLPSGRGNAADTHQDSTVSNPLVCYESLPRMHHSPAENTDNVSQESWNYLSQTEGHMTL